MVRRNPRFRRKRRKRGGGGRRRFSRAVMTFEDDVAPDQLLVEFKDSAEWIDQLGNASDFANLTLRSWNSFHNDQLYVATASDLIGFDRVRDSYTKYRMMSSTIRISLRTVQDSANSLLHVSGFYIFIYAHPSGDGTTPPWCVTANSEAVNVGSTDRTKQISLMKRDPRCKWVYFPSSVAGTVQKTKTKAVSMRVNPAWVQAFKMPSQVAVDEELTALIQTSPTTPSNPTKQLKLSWGILMDDTDVNVPPFEFSLDIRKRALFFNRKTDLLA